ncbi:DUF5687 family protein [Leptobacterium sp. I13]|uniref:DUF5687 family protein n=1 Tax=Leptobacterium meishanense TaxID=3128904 RepID=UPI0030ED8AC9
MFKHFFILQWKSFFRASSVGKSIGLKILMGFLALYFSAVFLGLGIGLYPLLKKISPEADPLTVVNQYVVLWLAADLIFRFFMQTLPVIDIKPLMYLPIKKGKIVHYILLRALTSFFNILPLFAIIPFGIICIAKGDYSPLSGTVWILNMFLLILMVNYTNFLIKKKFAENLKKFLPFIMLGGLFAALEYFNVFKISEFIGNILNSLTTNPIYISIPFLVLMGLYKWNYNFLKSHFYLDTSFRPKTKEANTNDMGWIRRFGDIAPFLQQDLKLIWRNKRPKTTIWISLLIVGYGLIFYPQETYQDMPAIFVFVGIFITGIFMINFGQFIPAWDSGYYSMMMAQNIPMKKYLASKMGLMNFSVIVLFLLSTPYVYFGWNILVLNVACAIYNMGVNVPILLYAGSFNRKRIDLDKSPFMNYQGTGATQWLVGLPLMLFPLAVWFLFYKLTSYQIATFVIGIAGITGLLLRNYLMEIIVRAYRKNKYAMINGFKKQGE